MMNGWIKLHRKITEWEWYDDANTFRVFIHLLLTANHKDSRYRGFKIPKGSVVTGREKLAEALKLSERKVRTALDKLIESGEITKKTTNSFSVISICNYEAYQSPKNDNRPTDDQQMTSNRPTDDQQMTTSEEGKKGRREERGGRFTPPTPDQVQRYAEERGHSDSIANKEAHAFFDHHSARDWVLSNGKKMKDWKAAFRTWERNMHKYSEKYGKSKRDSDWGF